MQGVRHQAKATRGLRSSSERRATTMADKVAPEERNRHVVHVGGKEVYAWEQTMDDVNVYVRAPERCRAKELDVELRKDGIRLALRGNTPYLDHRWSEPIRTSESCWTLEDGVITLVLAKRERGKAWKGLLVGQEEFDPAQENEERKRLMLERFQRENPGFDFSGAELTGCCPDASQFMGGVASGT